ncbi:MAG: hypothetical protein B6D61_00210 [Bacteroidetes bacterium 4484_249]|nr:MAG: hypothetical protein B6D61_00210 [Bacteroidetes bacterium 4484_249]
MKKFYSNGKLLLSGEYLILKGATALAAPLNFGQSLETSQSENKNIIWESYVYDKLWFSAVIHTDSFKIIETSDKSIAANLIKVLGEAMQLNKNFLNNTNFSFVVSKADFDLQWGLGSSSSLISNIAYWADIDPFLLHKKVATGSGYDVICARQNGPVFFELNKNDYSIEEVNFKPSFKENIYFIYLGNKQDSSDSVEKFNLSKRKYKNETVLVSDLTKHIAYSKNLDDFEYYIKEHEYILSSVLKKKMLKDERFRDFQGEMKSLGAWGGDFAMITWEDSKNELERYLKSKNINVIFRFDELIKTW